MQIVTAFWI